MMLTGVTTLMIAISPWMKNNLVSIDERSLGDPFLLAADTLICKVSYIGNMGVLIESNGKTVLIDGLHQKYKPAYQHPTDQMIEDLLDGTYEDFTVIEVNLVTHKHEDHFNSGVTLEFLRNNQQAISIGSAQILEEMQQVVFESERAVLDRVREIDYDFQVHEFQHRGINIKSIRSDHTYQIKHKDIQNIVFLMEMDSFRILHVGDTDWDLGTRALKLLNTSKTEIDIAVLPYWMMLGDASKEKLLTLVDPKMVLVSHIDPNLIDQVEEETKLEIPNVMFLNELMETIHYRK